MLTKSSAALKVNSQKSQERLMLGSEGLVTDGSTSAGPGLRRKVNVPSTENQIRLPARWGTVTVVVLPGAPRGMAQSWLRAEPVEEGDVG